MCDGFLRKHSHAELLKSVTRRIVDRRVLHLIKMWLDCPRGRNRHEVGALLDRGHPEVVDADLADYFGSIPHAELLKSVTRRIVDRRVLHLIKMWLDCPVEETDDRGRKTRTTEARDNRRGIPQGSPMAPRTQ